MRQFLKYSKIVEVLKHWGRHPSFTKVLMMSLWKSLRNTDANGSKAREN